MQCDTCDTSFYRDPDRARLNQAVSSELCESAPVSCVAGLAGLPGRFERAIRDPSLRGRAREAREALVSQIVARKLKVKTSARRALSCELCRLRETERPIFCVGFRLLTLAVSRTPYARRRQAPMTRYDLPQLHTCDHLADAVPRLSKPRLNDLMSPDCH